MDAPIGRRAADPELLRLTVSRVLIVGIAVSATLLLVGFVTAVLVGWGGSLVGRPAVDLDFARFTGLLDGLAALRPASIGQLGLLALVATPILRVFASLLLFVVERDRVYVAISLVVLTVLLASLLVIR